MSKKQNQSGKSVIGKELLVKMIAKDLNITQSATNAFMKSFVDNVKKALIQKKKVRLLGFGTFKTIVRGEAKSFNPKPRHEVHVPAKRVARFKYSDKINPQLPSPTPEEIAATKRVKK